MPWYNDLRPTEDPNKQKYSITFPGFKNKNKVRTIDNLMLLRNELKPIRNTKKTNNNVLLASWNIKQFGFLKTRIPDSYFYISEIISSFDIVAVQELKKGLEDLKIIMKLLGSNWKYIINDITEGNAGNDERFAYIYDTRRINFTGLAGEIVLWKDILDENENFQIKRTPYITGFRAGWKSFAIVNLHLQPDNNTKGKKIRKREVELLTKAINSKIKNNNLWSDNIVLIGDFNLYEDNTDIVKILNDSHFFESDLTEGLNTNTAITSSEPFDRILFRKNPFFEIPTKANNNVGGVLEIFDILYKLEDYKIYKEEMLAHKGDPSTLKTEKKFKNYYRDYWRKNQLSDHKPIWVEINIDSTDNFLALKRKKLIE